MSEHAQLEQEIEALSRQLGVELKKPEQKGREEKAVLREIVRERYAPPAPPTSSSQATPLPPHSGSAFLPNYLSDAPPETRLEVEKLIDLAWHRGINEAVDLAYREGLFFFEAFHDALTDKLYNEFKARGLLK